MKMINIGIIISINFILIFILGFIITKNINRETEEKNKMFNICVREIIEDGGTNAEAVRYCNGGN